LRSTEESSTLKTSYYGLLLYMAIFGAFASLVTADTSH